MSGVKDSLTDDKRWIIQMFLENIEGKAFEEKSAHDGKEGHFIERCYGVAANSRNEPDIRGYELKKCSNKITFFDLAGVYLFSKNRDVLIKYDKEAEKGMLGIIAEIELGAAALNVKKRHQFVKSKFIQKFGTSKMKPNGCSRFSWSGTCFPKIGGYNDVGQMLEVDKELNIVAYYDQARDKRVQGEPSSAKVPIAIWSRDVVETALNNKFGKRGFVLCKKDAAHIYRSVCFGAPITFPLFIEKFREGAIIIDSGMKENNARNYSHFRAAQNFWLGLVEEEWTKDKFSTVN